MSPEEFRVHVPMRFVAVHALLEYAYALPSELQYA
jgi:hypothetical protein